VTSPAVSIIILNHDKAAYTRACLQSLLQVGAGEKFEVIAVDNGSRDETPELLESLKPDFARAGSEIKIVTNAENVGAIIGRNQAMEIAGGDDFLFMDNDVVAGDDGWLAALRSRLDADASIGIIGPKLLFPWEPHLIEFAGCAVSPSGRIQYMGRGATRDDPAFNTEREVQCLISACILFRRGLVEEIGNLDEAFSPVQYEDLDFCYRTRRAGHRVVYTHKVEMYHFEHTTTGGSPDINFRYVTIKNGKLFKKRWRHMFETESGPPDEECAWAAIEKKSIKEIDEREWKTKNGGYTMANGDELRQNLKQMIVERLFLKVDPVAMTDDAPLMATYGIDSVALFELVVGLEEDFGITLEDEEFSLDLFENVNSVAALVERKQGA